MRKKFLAGLFFLVLFSSNLVAQHLDIQLSGYGYASTSATFYGSATSISLSTRWTAYLNGRALSEAQFYELIGDNIAWEEEVKTISLKKKLFWGGLLAMGIAYIGAELDSQYADHSSEVIPEIPGWTTTLFIIGSSASAVGLFYGSDQIRPAVYAIRKAEEFNNRRY